MTFDLRPIVRTIRALLGRVRDDGELENLCDTIDAKLAAADLVDKFLLLTPEEREKEYFFIALRGDRVDIEHLKYLLEENTHESTSD